MAREVPFFAPVHLHWPFWRPAMHGLSQANVRIESLPECFAWSFVTTRRKWSRGGVLFLSALVYAWSLFSFSIVRKGRVRHEKGRALWQNKMTKIPQSVFLLNVKITQSHFHENKKQCEQNLWQKTEWCIAFRRLQDLFPQKLPSWTVRFDEHSARHTQCRLVTRPEVASKQQLRADYVASWDFRHTKESMKSSVLNTFKKFPQVPGWTLPAAVYTPQKKPNKNATHKKRVVT